jgi:hypothetical protein
LNKSRSALLPIDPTSSFAAINPGDVMNTAMARRLSLRDRVVWNGRDGQPGGLGTIVRITAHEVEVCWDGGTVTRYRRAHLHNLRHAKLSLAMVETRDRIRHLQRESLTDQLGFAGWDRMLDMARS